MNESQLATCTGATLLRASLYLPSLTAAMAEYEIDSPKRQAAFLAQIGHESGGLKYAKEIWGPNDAQMRYEKRLDLGNTQPGDGKRYMGRGLIQLTGRSNYTKYGAILNLPLVEQPEIAEQPDPAARIAACFWAWHSCNDKADADDFEAITRKINGGLNGYKERCALWERAKQALGVV